MTTFNGDAIFGDAVSVIVVSNPTSLGLDRYFNHEGKAPLLPPNCERAFVVSGVLSGKTIGDLTAVQNVLLDYAHGVPSDLVDARGRTWRDVTFSPDDYHPSPTGPRPLAGGGWCLAYRIVLVQVNRA